jgi:hypothetical protein
LSRHATRSWSFWWICRTCDQLREFLVTEAIGSKLPVLARCGKCTYLMTVTDAHRAAARKEKELGLG